MGAKASDASGKNRCAVCSDWEERPAGVSGDKRYAVCREVYLRAKASNTSGDIGMLSVGRSIWEQRPLMLQGTIGVQSAGRST